MIARILSAALGLGLATLPMTQASADPLPLPGQSEDGWRYNLTLTGFLPTSTTGTSTVNGNAAPFDLSLSDVLNLLDFAAAGRVEAWNGNLGVIVDASYTSISANGTGPVLGTLYGVNNRQKWFSVMGAYRVAYGTNAGNGQPYSIDLQAGARYNSIRQVVTIQPPFPAVGISAGGDESWIEPVIGARGMWRLNDRWTTVASLELGGFGVGGNDLQVAAAVGFDYRPWERTSLSFGYRYFSVDYSTTQPGGLFAYDTVQHGPYIGLKIDLN
ncbi:MAG: hypothetical protein COC12_05775 [Rhodobacteraceae bacterium]|nr:MAG: hypothetical protein COC12_05775 [Paracoccaceae bacterium]